mmetsp:Transcript_17933/g.34150  ORF Transcript_17933/g.34150 Transcript_17933/m.34150 type:complete len:336 (+) Transcript_17933:92-1099(+)
MAPPEVSTSSGRKRGAPIKVESSPSPLSAAKKKPRLKPTKEEEANVSNNTDEELKERFISLFSQEQYEDGVSNSQLKAMFGAEGLAKLVPIINELSRESRLVMSKMEGNEKELFYKLVSEEVASKFAGLDPSARLVYQSIQRTGVNGAWTKDIRRETNIQQQALNKIFKALETRRLIKQVKSVNAKAKKLYMLYELQPSTELTGGVWYSDLEFDHEFISELRGFLMQCLRRLHNGRGCTITEILRTMEQANVSKVKLNEENVQQLMQTLLFDHLVEEAEAEDGSDKMIYSASRRVSTACDFKWWSDALSTDFHFRTIKFEDGVVLEPHEPHYHTA